MAPDVLCSSVSNYFKAQSGLLIIINLALTYLRWFVLMIWKYESKADVTLSPSHDNLGKAVLKDQGWLAATNMKILDDLRKISRKRIAWKKSCQPE